jgi:hypothetical protein
MVKGTSRRSACGHRSDIPRGAPPLALHTPDRRSARGWGFLVQAQAYRHLVGRLSGYLFGSYMLSPREKTEVLFSPSFPASFVSVPDVYHARLGFAYAAWPEGGLSLSLGGRVDGVPVHDIIGGDLGFRNPGYTLFLEPGLSVERGRGAFTLSVPVRLRGNFVPSANDEAGNPGPGPDGARGDLAAYLILPRVRASVLSRRASPGPCKESPALRRSSSYPPARALLD